MEPETAKEKVMTSLPCKTDYCCEHVSFVYHFLLSCVLFQILFA
jgi:hypothetical protein